LPRKYDNDGNGTLTKGELTRALRDIGLKLTFNEVADLMEHIDPNQDGSFSYVEFAELLLKDQNRHSYILCIGGGGDFPFWLGVQSARM
jgi:Ca2+-binding EF-hand superfamily protein